MSKKRQERFLKLYKPVHERFEKFCRARAYGDMPYEDLINESLLIAFKKFETLKNEKVFLSFIIGISIRVLSNSRKKMKAETMDDEQLLINHPNPSENIDQKLDVELLYKSLSQIPKEQSEALILFEVTGFTIKEITNIQNCSESSVKQRLARGRRALAKAVIKEMNYKSEVQ